jgi:hypothetical protein
MPTEEELKKLPIEDAGIPDSIRVDKAPAGGGKGEYGYLFRYYPEGKVINNLIQGILHSR